MDLTGFDSDTQRGFDTESGTDTESVASSRNAGRNRKKKDAKKKSAAARKAAASIAVPESAASSSSAAASQPPEGVTVEYVSAEESLVAAFPDLKEVFGKFATAEELVAPTKPKGGDTDAAAEASEDPNSVEGLLAASKQSAAAAAADEEEAERELSRRAKKRAKRLSIAELKQLVPQPELVEAWDVTSDDPRLLVHLKSYRNSIPVPKHWCQKRKFLMGKKGFEKPPFALPDFIAATGIEKIRASVLEKENAKKLKGKMKEKMQPKMGKIDIDYQVLHDAFFKFQTKPHLTRHGDLYYEGKEHEAQLRMLRPGALSAELSQALEIPAGGPPPWLVNMQRYGPPPSYQSLKIPGLNAPIPTGSSYGYHAGGWGKPPVDEFGRPLYGDVFGTAEDAARQEVLYDGLSREPWGKMDEEEDEDDEEEDSDDDADGTNADNQSEVTDDDIAAGISSVTSTSAASGVATPDSVHLRKQLADGMGTPSGTETPDSQHPQLYHVLEQTSAKVGAAAFGSSHGYVVPPPPPAGIGTAGGANNVKGKGKAAAAAGGIEMALDPSELESLDEGALKARYEALKRAEREASAPEDVSDIIEEQERKRRRKQEGGRR